MLVISKEVSNFTLTYEDYTTLKLFR